MSDLSEYLQQGRERIERGLEQHLPLVSGPLAAHVETMRYSLMAGGKRVRPILTLAAFATVSGEEMDDDLLPLALALECIHTYSLIHDDLPAMDDDDLRRGQATSHIKFGEAGAILAGDGLLTFAFELASRPTTLTAAAQLRIINIIARAAGSFGMVGGQCLDIEAEGRDTDLGSLKQIHALKTGALITAALQVGAVAAGADDRLFAAITRYGRAIGLAFQIADDLLNVESTASELGKAAGSDAARGKATYPAILGLCETRKQARACVDNALTAMEIFPDTGANLKALAQYIIERKS